jgi:hypothetical protein
MKCSVLQLSRHQHLSNIQHHRLSIATHNTIPWHTHVDGWKEHGIGFTPIKIPFLAL